MIFHNLIPPFSVTIIMLTRFPERRGLNTRLAVFPSPILQRAGLYHTHLLFVSRQLRRSDRCVRQAGISGPQRRQGIQRQTCAELCQCSHDGLSDILILSYNFDSLRNNHPYTSGTPPTHPGRQCKVVKLFVLS